MQQPAYNYSTGDYFLDYIFISEGPKGKIEKVVRFTRLNFNTYNLSFGDLNKANNIIDDLIVSDNQDRDKILNTVAQIVVEFLNQYPNRYVAANGSTKSRNRLYRMAISKNLNPVKGHFEILGLRGGEWDFFELNTDYDAFLIRRK